MYNEYLLKPKRFLNLKSPHLPVATLTFSKRYPSHGLQIGFVKLHYYTISSQPEMGIYRDNLSAIVIGDNLLPIIVIAENSFGSSITDVAFVIYFVIADTLSR